MGDALLSLSGQGKPRFWHQTLGWSRSAADAQHRDLPQSLSLTLLPFFLSSQQLKGLLFFPGVCVRHPLQATNANHALSWWQRPIHGAAAFNELAGTEGPRQDKQFPNNSHLHSPSAWCCWPAAFQDAGADLPKACRQVYEIKARHTINNLAANHKKKNQPQTLPVLYRSKAIGCVHSFKMHIPFIYTDPFDAEPCNRAGGTTGEVQGTETGLVGQSLMRPLANYCSLGFPSCIPVQGTQP